jgi:hypothetical protein
VGRTKPNEALEMTDGDFCSKRVRKLELHPDSEARPREAICLLSMDCFKRRRSFMERSKWRGDNIQESEGIPRSWGDFGRLRRSRGADPGWRKEGEQEETQECLERQGRKWMAFRVNLLTCSNLKFLLLNNG